MITKLNQVMLYVENQDEAIAFWTKKIGFVIISEESQGDMRWFEIAPSIDSETSLILHNKEIIKKISPELNLGTPSLMFATDNVDDLYQKLIAQNVNVGEIINIPTGKILNFSDAENNYFAVMEQKS